MVDFAAEKGVMGKLGVLVRVLGDKDSGFAADGDSVEISSMSGEMEVEEDVALRCETPKRGIFDPFAPAADDLAFAPRKKALKVAAFPLRRRLDFDDCIDNAGGCDEHDDDEEERISESLRASILDFIVSAQLAEMASKGFDTVSEVKTPTSVRLLTGIAETCPDAPKRARPVWRRKTEGICRRLEFGDDSP